MRVPPRSSPGYVNWSELNPRDSISIALGDSIVSMRFGDNTPSSWITDGIARVEPPTGSIVYRTRARWNKDGLSLYRARIDWPEVERKFRLTRDSTLELTFPGVVRHPDFPKKLVFSRDRPAP